MAKGNQQTVIMTQEALTALLIDRVNAALGAYAQQQHGTATATYNTFMDRKPQTCDGVDRAVGLLKWFEKTESVFAKCNCPEANQGYIPDTSFVANQESVRSSSIFSPSIMNHSSFCRLVDPMKSSSSGVLTDASCGPSIGKLKQGHNTCCAKALEEPQPFSLICCPCSSTKSVCETTSTSDLSTRYEILGSGVILMRNYLSLKDQVEIVNICQKWGVGPGGFYEPRNRNGAKLRLQMMCLGRNWDPITKYKARYRSDGSEAPPLPSELSSLTKIAIQDAQAHLSNLPSMCPDICIVNFYSPIHGGLGLHQDRDESSDSLRKGLPVVSISIGDTAEFVYGPSKNKKKLERLLLQSGDVLIFGGKSRGLFHGVKQVFQNTAPLPLLQQTGLRPGRLNLTLRQY